MTQASRRDWIVCQIGAREHYAIAAELHERGRLAALCTDLWGGPGSAWRAAAALFESAGQRSVAQRLRERFTPTLAGARVLCGAPHALLVRRLARLVDASGHRGGIWHAIMAENRSFAASTATRLERWGLFERASGANPAVFAYSYAALEIIAAAKRAGCPTVLGQIDPGPAEYALVAETASRHGFADVVVEQPPARYWEDWRAECALADIVVVNSSWSADLVARAGVDPSKLRVAPLAYRSEGATSHPREYPDRFSAERPLRLLFLGQVSVRKGAVELLQAMSKLTDAPVRLQLVGPIQDGLAERFGDTPKVDWLGPVPRGATTDYYRDADVFILPTHSDGFAITQLEAQAQALPVFASPFCGEVVAERINGRIIETVSADAIEKVARWAINNPSALAAMSAQATARVSDFTPAKAVDLLIGAFDDEILDGPPAEIVQA